MSERSIPEGWSAVEAPGLGGGLSEPIAKTPDQDFETVPPSGPQGNGNKLPRQSKWQRWSRSWVLWIVIGGLTSCGAGIVAVALILRLPGLPSCSSIFWPTASASMRLYCAQSAADKHTVDELLRAIALVQVLPPNHPLHSEINRHLKQWSLEMLDLGDQEFQAGHLDEAIAIAHKVPSDLPAFPLVRERIATWQSTWSAAEDIYHSARVEIHQQRWHQAFSYAASLLSVNNNYWATTKYEELNNRIETARTDSRELAKADSLAKAGGLENLLAAVKIAESIGADSDFFQTAQAAIPEYGRQLLDLAQAALDQHNTDAAVKIASSIPESAKLQAEVQDFTTIAGAWRDAWSDTIPSLQSAIAVVQNIGSDRPMYSKAQELLDRWQLQIGDVAHLEKARELAQGGEIKDLQAAMTEAQLIPDQNPDASERDEEVTGWRRRIETIEDRPYLDKAEQIASGGDINSLQAAIDAANQIASGRALYQEAQSKVANWTNQIQRMQDQPYLDQARTLASNGDLPGAIAEAQNIQPGRALSSEAQAAITDWQGQIQARENWQSARSLAQQGTPEALREAIQKADQVPTTSPLRTDVNSAISQWSYQILSIAQDRGASDLPGAIAIAKQIPPGTDAYKAAQTQIAIWQKFLNPPPEQQTPSPASPEVPSASP
ncbi:MAG: phage tail tape measure protein [Chroococcidiopsidaceae cyanobacterium CP_BM_RX_35]|nr:phage tail tape measure protein [Chroococcidiopsidaceae cyanobacterium CP_BM_RX_35]